MRLYYYMALYRKKILLLTLILIITIGWGGYCTEGYDCNACCHSEPIEDIEASELEGQTIWKWEDRCEQSDDMSGNSCNVKRKNSQSSGCPCNPNAYEELNDWALTIDGVENWYENNFLNGCGCLSKGNNPENFFRSCCVVGFFNGSQSVEYSCGGGDGGDGILSTPIDCNTQNCEDIYSDEDNDGYDDASYVAGFEEGILLGGQSGDANGDGALDILDIVYFIDVILNP